MPNPEALKTCVFRQLLGISTEKHEAVFLNDDFIRSMVHFLSCAGNTSDQFHAVELLCKIFKYDSKLLKRYINGSLMTHFVTFIIDNFVFSMCHDRFYKVVKLTQVMTEASPSHFVRKLINAGIVDASLGQKKLLQTHMIRVYYFYGIFFEVTPSPDVLKELTKVLTAMLASDSNYNRMEAIIWLENLPLSDFSYATVICESKCFKQLRTVKHSAGDRDVRKAARKVVRQLRYSLLLTAAFERMSVM